MKAIMPVFDESRKKPYYLQLYEYIKERILSGDIKEGEKLPSLRSLSKSTELSITTIEQSYNQLLVEGYIHSRAQSGYYVSNVFSHSSQSPSSEKNSFFLKSSSLEEVMRSSPPSYYYDPDCFDFNKWKKCMNKIINEYSPTFFFESAPRGEEALRIEIARYLYVSRGVECMPDQIVIGAGTQQITNQLATILRKMSIENAALEDPGYMPVRNIFRDRGFAITPVKVGSDGLMIEKLPTNIKTAAYVSPSNHVFTGSVMPVGRRYELLNWAEENNSYIIEDDYDSELRYFGRPIPALKSLKGNDRVIYLGSFSTTLFAAVKISYMVLPEKMTRLFTSMASDYSQTCSKTEQLTLAMFMETGNYQTHIKKLRKLYSQKLAAASDILSKEGGDFIDMKNRSSGINILLKVRTEKSGEQLRREAASLRIPAVPLEDSDLLILYYNQIPLHKMAPALKELVALWRS